MNGISAFGSKDGLRTYTWHAENRLSSMAMDGNAGYATRIKLDFLYDSENRRVSKAVSTTTSQVVSPTWTLQITTRFLYDGWKMIAQYSFAFILLRIKFCDRKTVLPACLGKRASRLFP